MELVKTKFDGLFVLQTINAHDDRGSFQKLFNYDFFVENGLDTDFKEFYYSVNEKGARRGMHFQVPPFDHTKIVYVSKGRILDVCVDIRKKSVTFRKCFSIELNENDGRYLYIPRGFAHGFWALEENSIVNYAQTSCYNKECDCGILQDSIDFEWGEGTVIASKRDLEFPKLSEYESPF